MGLLDRALNFAQKAYNYVVGNDDETMPATANKAGHSASANKPASVVAQQQKVNSVINEKENLVGTVGDTIERKQDDVKAKKTDNTTLSVPKQKKTKIPAKNNKPFNQSAIQTKLIQLKEKIQNKCAKFGISYLEAEDAILSNMQFSYDEFKNLSQYEQLGVLYSIDAALSLYIADKNKKQISPEADKAAVIGQTARNIKIAKEEGGIEDISDFTNGAGDINKELSGKINDNTTDEEYYKLFEESRESFRASFEIERRAAIRKAHGDKAKIAEINKRYDARLASFEQQRQTELAAAVGPKRARFTIYLRGANDFAEAHATALNVYSGNARMQVADSFTHDFEVEAKRRYYMSGDPISSEQFAKAVTYTTQYMSEDALNKYQTDAYNFRKKVESGEIDAPYMSEEDFTAESVAIGVGITNNNNISTQAKAELLNKWENNALAFSDYAKVKDAYNKAVNALASNSTYNEQVVANIKKVYKENYGYDLDILPAAWKMRNNQNTSIKPKATEATLKSELKIKSVTEIKKNYGNSMQELTKIILSNDIEYKNRIDDIMDYLKCFSGTDIGLKISGCSTSTISKIIMAFPDKSNEILDVVAPTMCFTGKKAVEHIVEERRENATA